eukprot:CAMPEP_0194206768 /NCGR_PEP_ID=MMETSP0156-20130528/5716_1 /TAXON_ID=33649 /ORGANISM="Thalassionema nitzschioides, Strain L26-B" /LENGTH=164 /DNA_ID=CAMNT_0038933379 /DNA_START=237 /DNA_END=731 /DNA_ORIENTATION=+
MDLSAPYHFNNFNESNGCILSNAHRQADSEKGTSLLSLINASSIPLSREFETRGMKYASSTPRTDDWRIIAPPKEIITMSTLPSESWNSPIPRRTQLQSPSVHPPPVSPEISVAKTSARSKLPPLMEVMIGEGDEVQNRIAGIVYTYEENSDDESVLSDLSWDD